METDSCTNCSRTFPKGQLTLGGWANYPRYCSTCLVVLSNEKIAKEQAERQKEQETRREQQERDRRWAQQDRQEQENRRVREQENRRVREEKETIRKAEEDKKFLLRFQYDEEFRKNTIKQWQEDESNTETYNTYYTEKWLIENSIEYKEVLLRKWQNNIESIEAHDKEYKDWLMSNVPEYRELVMAKWKEEDRLKLEKEERKAEENRKRKEWEESPEGQAEIAKKKVEEEEAKVAAKKRSEEEIAKKKVEEEAGEVAKIACEKAGFYYGCISLSISLAITYLLMKLLILVVNPWSEPPTFTLMAVLVFAAWIFLVPIVVPVAYKVTELMYGDEDSYKWTAAGKARTEFLDQYNQKKS